MEEQLLSTVGDGEPIADEFSEFQNQESPSEKVRIGDEEFDLETARELISKGKNATQKWQEAAELRREAEAEKELAEQMRALRNRWEQDPDAVLSELQAARGTPQKTRYDIDEDTLTENERKLYDYNRKMAEQLDSALQKLDRADWLAKEVAADKQAQIVAEKLEQQFGQRISALDLRRLMEKHGTSNPETAWKAEYFGHTVQKESKPKPNIPSPTGKKGKVPLSKLDGPAHIQKALDAGYEIDETA
jgi:hypothetical protein